MNIGLHVENVYFVVTSINPFVPTVAFSQLSFPHYAERQSLGQQMLELGCENATVGKNGLIAIVSFLIRNEPHRRCECHRRKYVHRNQIHHG